MDQNLLRQLKKHASRQWMIFGLIFAILLSYLWPDLGKSNGYLKTNLWTNNLCIVLIFLHTGISIQSQILRQAFLKVHLHVIMQIINLGLIPLYTFGFVRLISIPQTVDPLLLEGILVMAVMPATVSTCIVYTQLANGNTALAIIDSALGNFLGIFISPLYLILIENRNFGSNYGDLLLNLLLVVFLPFVIGQAIRIFFPKLTQFVCKMPGFKYFTGILVLVMVWCAFSNAFGSNTTVGISALYVFFVIVLLYLINTFMTGAIFVLLNWMMPPSPSEDLMIATAIRFSWEVTREDVVAAICTVPQKTMAMGLPLIQLVYFDRPNEIAIVGLPLIFYHAIQLFLNGLMIPYLKRYVAKNQAVSVDSSDDEENIKDVELSRLDSK
eukprot:NODE_65_length_25825_cov_1.353844.p8 type:complete len:383 gc:universal NODE_65_length_25825_cov_1.353844:16673-17821(+)